MNAPTPTKSLQDLIVLLKTAKFEEHEAKQRRLAIEQMVIDALPAKEEGSITEKTDNGTVSVTYGFTRKVDGNALLEDWDSLPREAQKAFNWKPEVSVSAMRKIQELLPDVYLKITKYITATPSKPTVSIK